MTKLFHSRCIGPHRDTNLTSAAKAACRFGLNAALKRCATQKLGCRPNSTTPDATAQNLKLRVLLYLITGCCPEFSRIVS